jgi:FkbM family methyltransferase
MQMMWQDSTEMALGLYEPSVADTLRREIRAGDFCVDVGAHIGYHAILMSMLVGPEGEVVAFEPFPPTFQFLLENAKLNAAANLKSENIAIGEHREMIKLVFSADEALGMTPSISGYAVKRRQAVVEVPSIPLDIYLDRFGRAPSLIQIDVEGAEMSVLRGAEATLRRARPKLLVEIHGWETEARQEVFRFLSRLGYAGDVVGRRGNEGFVLFH